MKKTLMLLIGCGVLVSSCGTYTGTGAVAGGTLGAVLGSAVGGIAGGWRGHDVGTVVGMATGAAVGAAMGAAADQQAQRDYEQYQADRAERRAERQYGNSGSYGNNSNGSYGNSGSYGNNNSGSYGSNDSGFDATNSGDDRIDFDGAGPRDGHGTYTAAAPRAFTPSKSTVEPGYSVHFNSLIEIRNARVIDADHDGVIRRGEECEVTFEIMNRSSMTIYDVQPTVFDTTGNKHIHISPNLHIESIAPNSGVRYTATILADSKLKDGTAVIRVGVAQGNKEITSQMQEFVLQTRKK